MTRVGITLTLGNSTVPNLQLQAVLNIYDVTFIDKTDPSYPTRREDFWIDTLKTRYHLRLNKIDPLITLTLDACC